MLQQVDDLLFDEYRSWGDGSESAAESASNHANAVLALPVWLIATGFFVISTHVWFAIGTSVASAVVAVNRGVGSRQTLADVRLAFMNYSARVSHSISFEMPRIFMEVDLTRGARRILATSLMQNCFLPLKKKILPNSADMQMTLSRRLARMMRLCPGLGEPATFALLWNAIIASMRGEDLLSDHQQVISARVTTCAHVC